MVNESVQIKDIVNVLFLALINVITAFNHAGPTFLNYIPKFRCKDHENEDPCNIVFNSSQSRISENGHCEAYEYMGSDGEVSIATEWNLVCDEEIYSVLCTTVYFIAVGIGALVSGALADRYGRKTVLYSCIFIQASIGIVISFAVHIYIMYLILRFFQGLFIPGILTCAYLLANESLPAKYRTWSASTIEIFWSIGLVFMAGLAYLLPNWRDLNYAMCLIPSLVACVSIWFVPESKVWLNARNGNIKEINPQMENSSKKNKKTVNLELASEMSNSSEKSAESTINNISEKSFSNTEPPEFVNKSKINENEIKVPMNTNEASFDAIKHVSNENYKSDQRKEKSNDQSNSLSYQLKSILTNSDIRSKFLFIMLAWFALALSYYGLTFYIPELSGNHYINFAIGGAVEIIFFVVLSYLIGKIGRRLTLTGAYIISGMCYFGVAFLTNDSDWMVGFLRTLLAITGKGCTMGNSMCLLLYAIELFSPELRGLTLGVSFCCNEIGACSSPIVLLLEIKNLWVSIPIFIFAALNVATGLLGYCVLPDEVTEELPSTTQDSVEYNKK